jgi:hypothetical protein
VKSTWKGHWSMKTETVSNAGKIYVDKGMPGDLFLTALRHLRVDACGQLNDIMAALLMVS